MHRNWLVNRTNSEFLQHISGRTSVSPLLAQILVNRGIKEAEAIQKFLNPSLVDLHDPFLLPDMDKAVSRLVTAVKRGEKIFILGDYDADGITSTALLVSAFRKLGLETQYHIPNRITEGYGLSEKGIRKAKDFGAAVIVSVDCGVSSHDEVLKARSMGMDVIVTDHHEPPDTLPDATAVIDPHRKDSSYPFRYLAGVGVALKLAEGLFQGLDRRLTDGELRQFLDLVTIGTIADSVPLLDENRIFISFGMKQINSESCRKGIQALKKVSDVHTGLGSGQLAFSVIPRINAAGRLDDAGCVVDLFLTEDEGTVASIANILNDQNRKRQKIEADVLRDALAMITPGALQDAIVLASHDWHPGVIGIVASRLVERFYRPVFLFSIKDSIAKGSARGIPPFHLYNAIAECSELLLGFGGHRQAAGLKISEDRLDEFRKAMNMIAAKTLAKEDMTPVLQIDAAVTFSELNLEVVRELALLEPYGEGNREPVLGARNTEVVNHRIVGSRHLKMYLRQGRVSLDSIGFGMADKLGSITNAGSLDIAFAPSVNEWNGTKTLQLTLKGVRPSG